MVTSDMPEALGMRDRIVVLHEARGEPPRAQADDRSVLSLALGTASTAGGTPV